MCHISGYSTACLKATTIATRIKDLILAKNAAKKKPEKYAKFIEGTKQAFDAGFKKTTKAIEKDPHLSIAQKSTEKKFIKDQQSIIRKFSIGGLDQSTKKKYDESIKQIEKKTHRLDAEKVKIHKEIERKAEPEFIDWSYVQLEDDNFEDVDVDGEQRNDNDEDFNCEITKSALFKVTGEKNIKDVIAKTTPVAVANGISENTQFLMISSIIDALGVSLKELSISRTGLKSVRNRTIQQHGESLKERAVKKLGNVPVQLFIDGKELTHINKSQEKVTTERLTISGTNLNVTSTEDVLLEIVSVENATGIEMAEAVYKVEFYIKIILLYENIHS